MANYSSLVRRESFFPVGFAVIGPLLLIGCVILLALLIILTSGNQTGTNPHTVTSTQLISPKVMRWQGEIQRQMQQFGLPDHLLPYILALTMQESGGNHVDIMQSSESMCNGKIGCIHDPITSIYYGIRHFQAVWNKTNAKANASQNQAVKDFENLIKITLQSYNYGAGFVDYVFEHGGIFSEELAKSFSLKHSTKKTCGQRTPYCYGDYQYVAHVYRYLVQHDATLSSISSTELVTNPYPSKLNWPAEAQNVLDPSSRQGLVTRRTADMFQEVLAKGLFTLDGYNSANCYAKRDWGEHPVGRACDFVYRFRYPAEGFDLKNGTKLANYLVLNQQRLGVNYVIWNGKIWRSKEPEKGWQVYRSEYYHCPIPESTKEALLKSKSPHPLWTGCHYDHVHVSMY